MTPDVVRVTTSPDYCIVAEFESGETRQLDMRPFLSFPAFEALRDLAFFMKAHVAHGTVVWTDEIDISPDTIYLRGLPCSRAT